MGLIDIASAKSLWRGIDYYENKHAFACVRNDDGTYSGKVSGSESQVYDVLINLAHPKRSTCNCKFAEGRRVVCKHMVAVYFTMFPAAYDDFMREVEEYQEEEEQREEEYLCELEEYVYSLTKEELRERLLDALLEIDALREDRW